MPEDRGGLTQRRSGGGGGGGPVTSPTNLSEQFLGTWETNLADTGFIVTFSSNGNFSGTIISPTGVQTPVQGSWTATAAPAGSAFPVVLTLTSQGNVLLAGQTAFRSPGSVVFAVGTNNITDQSIAEIFMTRIG